MSQRQAARHFNISRDSVAKMMAFSVLQRVGHDLPDPAKRMTLRNPRLAVLTAEQRPARRVRPTRHHPGMPSTRAQHVPKSLSRRPFFAAF